MSNPQNGLDESQSAHSTSPSPLEIPIAIGRGGLSAHSTSPPLGVGVSSAHSTSPPEQGPAFIAGGEGVSSPHSTSSPLGVGVSSAHSTSPPLGVGVPSAHSTSPSPSERAGERFLSILSTAPLGTEVEQEALSMGIDLDIIPFINTQYIESKELTAKVIEQATKSTVVVFTSKHAVMSVAKKLGNVEVNWSIYCLGNKTKSTVNQYFATQNEEYNDANILGVADDARELANMIVNANVKKIVFFCGDKRMDILPDILADAQINVTEIVVYKTLETPHKIEKAYDGILFFSPSGVSGFFNMNNPTPGTVFFAIGNTTAAAIRKYAAGEIIISETPVKRVVFMDAVKRLKG